MESAKEIRIVLKDYNNTEIYVDGKFLHTVTEFSFHVKAGKSAEYQISGSFCDPERMISLKKALME